MVVVGSKLVRGTVARPSPSGPAVHRAVPSKSGREILRDGVCEVFGETAYDDLEELVRIIASIDIRRAVSDWIELWVLWIWTIFITFLAVNEEDGRRRHLQEEEEYDKFAVEEIAAEEEGEEGREEEEEGPVTEIEPFVKRHVQNDLIEEEDEEEEEEEEDVRQEILWKRTAGGGGLIRYPGLQNLVVPGQALENEPMRYRPLQLLQNCPLRREGPLIIPSVSNSTAGDEGEILEGKDTGDAIGEDAKLWASLVARYVGDDKDIDSTDKIPNDEAGETQEKELDGEEMPPWEKDNQLPKEVTPREFSAQLGKRLEEYLAHADDASSSGDAQLDGDVTADEIKEIEDEIADYAGEDIVTSAINQYGVPEVNYTVPEASYKAADIYGIHDGEVNTAEPFIPEVKYTVPEVSYRAAETSLGIEDEAVDREVQPSVPEVKYTVPEVSYKDSVASCELYGIHDAEVDKVECAIPEVKYIVPEVSFKAAEASLDKMIETSEEIQEAEVIETTAFVPEVSYRDLMLQQEMQRESELSPAVPEVSYDLADKKQTASDEGMPDRLEVADENFNTTFCNQFPDTELPFDDSVWVCEVTQQQIIKSQYIPDEQYEAVDGADDNRIIIEAVEEFVGPDFVEDKLHEEDHDVNSEHEAVDDAADNKRITEAVEEFVGADFVEDKLHEEDHDENSEHEAADDADNNRRITEAVEEFVGADFVEDKLHEEDHGVNSEHAAVDADDNRRITEAVEELVGADFVEDKLHEEDYDVNSEHEAVDDVVDNRRITEAVEEFVGADFVEDKLHGKEYDVNGEHEAVDDADDNRRITEAVEEFVGADFVEDKLHEEDHDVNSAGELALPAEDVPNHVNDSTYDKSSDVLKSDPTQEVESSLGMETFITETAENSKYGIEENEAIYNQQESRKEISNIQYEEKGTEECAEAAVLHVEDEYTKSIQRSDFVSDLNTAILMVDDVHAEGTELLGQGTDMESCEAVKSFESVTAYPSVKDDVAIEGTQPVELHYAKEESIDELSLFKNTSEEVAWFSNEIEESFPQIQVETEKMEYAKEFAPHIIEALEDANVKFKGRYWELAEHPDTESEMAVEEDDISSETQVDEKVNDSIHDLGKEGYQEIFMKCDQNKSTVLSQTSLSVELRNKLGSAQEEAGPDKLRETCTDFKEVELPQYMHENSVTKSLEKENGATEISNVSESCKQEILVVDVMDHENSEESCYTIKMDDKKVNLIEDSGDKMEVTVEGNMFEESGHNDELASDQSLQVTPVTDFWEDKEGQETYTPTYKNGTMDNITVAETHMDESYVTGIAGAAPGVEPFPVVKSIRYETEVADENASAVNEDTFDYKRERGENTSCSQNEGNKDIYNVDYSWKDKETTEKLASTTEPASVEQETIDLLQEKDSDENIWDSKMQRYAELFVAGDTMKEQEIAESSVENAQEKKSNSTENIDKEIELSPVDDFWGTATSSSDYVTYSWKEVTPVVESCVVTEQQPRVDKMDSDIVPVEDFWGVQMVANEDESINKKGILTESEGVNYINDLLENEDKTELHLVDDVRHTTTREFISDKEDKIQDKTLTGSLQTFSEGYPAIKTEIEQERPSENVNESRTTVTPLDDEVKNTAGDKAEWEEDHSANEYVPVDDFWGLNDVAENDFKRVHARHFQENLAGETGIQYPDNDSVGLGDYKNDALEYTDVNYQHEIGESVVREGDRRDISEDKGKEDTSIKAYKGHEYRDTVNHADIILDQKTRKELALSQEFLSENKPVQTMESGSKFWEYTGKPAGNKSWVGAEEERHQKESMPENEEIPPHLKEFEDLLTTAKEPSYLENRKWYDDLTPDDDEGTPVDEETKHLMSKPVALTEAEELELAELIKTEGETAAAEGLQNYLKQDAALTEEELRELEEIRIEQEAIRAAEQRQLAKFMKIPDALTEQELEEFEALENEEEDERKAAERSEAHLAALLEAARAEAGGEDLDDEARLKHYLNLPARLTKEEEELLAVGGEEIDLTEETGFSDENAYKEYLKQKYLRDLEEEEYRQYEDDEYGEYYDEDECDYEYDYDYDEEEDFEGEYVMMKEDTEGLGGGQVKNIMMKDEAVGTEDEQPSGNKAKKFFSELSDRFGRDSGYSKATKDSTEDVTDAKETRKKKFFASEVLEPKKKKRFLDVLQRGPQK